MELSKYLKEVLNKTKKAGAKIVEFDIGLAPIKSEGNTKILIMDDSTNRIRFSVLFEEKKGD